MTWVLGACRLELVQTLPEREQLQLEGSHSLPLLLGDRRESRILQNREHLKSKIRKRKGRPESMIHQEDNAQLGLVLALGHRLEQALGRILELVQG